jgi:hypothetical protein
MAKQLNFIATDVDLATIENILRQRQDVEILSEEPNPELSELLPLDALPIPLALSGRVSTECCLAPSNLPPVVKIQRISPVKTHIDFETSSLIEFGRPYYDGKITRPGRLYYQNKPYIDGRFEVKDPRFCKWADSVIAAVRKTLRRDPRLSFVWVGADAAAKLAAHQMIVENAFGQVIAS